MLPGRLLILSAAPSELMAHSAPSELMAHSAPSELMAALMERLALLLESPPSENAPYFYRAPPVLSPARAHSLSVGDVVTDVATQ